jgi:L-rhamnose isomerase
MRSSSMRAGTVFYPDRSIPISFKIRNTSTDRSGIPMTQSDNVHCGTRKKASKSLTASKSRDISFWFADGSNYPGTANIRQRKQRFEEALREAHRALSPDQRMLVEYKPLEPAFYHTDIADWGMALLLSRAAGPQAKVLVDTDHHYAAYANERPAETLTRFAMRNVCC